MDSNPFFVLFVGGWQSRRGLDFIFEMDATRHVVPGIWEPWAVVRENLSSGLNLASDHQVRLPVFSIGIVPPQCTIGGGSGLVVGFGGVLQQDRRTVNMCLTIRICDNVVIVVVVICICTYAPLPF